MNLPIVPVSLSTTSVFPESTTSAFELAALLGYDGVEVMVSPADTVCTDPDAVERLRDFYQVPVTAIHAPTLFLGQATWGTNPWQKLQRSAQAAQQLGAEIVVVHPAFRWQRDYAKTFIAGLRRLNEATGVRFCLENMYPWRTPGGEFKAYLPGWDPTDTGYEYLCLDLSHASTSRVQAMNYVTAWGKRLCHLHFTDGSGQNTDEHLLPGYGDQRAADVLEVAVQQGFQGQVVIEVSTRRAGSRNRRENDLAEALEFSRRHIERGLELNT